jgi:hypothetical protein
MWESAINSHKNDVVPLSIHNTDIMSNATDDDFFSYYNVTGVPTLVCGNVFDVWGATQIGNAITSTTAGTPIVGITGIMTYEGYNISAKTQVKFLTTTSGDYYLATYFAENGYSYNQSGAATNPMIHNHILMGMATTGDFHGELIHTGNAAANIIVNKNYTKTVNANWNMPQVYMALVVWKKTGTTWSFVNAWQNRAN